LVNNALPYARNRVLDHPKAPKTAVARPLGHPNRFARPLLDRPLVWWSGKPNRSPGGGGGGVGGGAGGGGDGGHARACCSGEQKLELAERLL